MNFIEPNLSSILEKISLLKINSAPLWGSMNAHRTIEHLTDAIRLSKGNHNFALEIPESAIEKAQGFLLSEHPMPKNFQVKFALPDTPTRTANLEEAKDEFEAAWREFEDFFENNQEKRTLHPNFGDLNHSLWLRLHSKHITHHLSQFGIV